MADPRENERWLRQQLDAARAETERVRTELTAETERVRTELTAETERVRTELTAEKNRHIDALTAEIAGLRTELGEQSATMAEQSATMAEQSATIARMERTLNDTNATVHRLEGVASYKAYTSTMNPADNKLTHQHIITAGRKKRRIDGTIENVPLEGRPPISLMRDPELRSGEYMQLSVLSRQNRSAGKAIAYLKREREEVVVMRAYSAGGIDQRQNLKKAFGNQVRLRKRYRYPPSLASAN